MTSPDPRQTSGPPILATSLLIAGLGCFCAALWVGQTDIAELLGQRIIRAGGSLSHENIVWLKKRAAILVVLVGMGFIGLAAAAFKLRALIQRFGERLLRLPFGATALTANLVMVLWYLPTLTIGFFRYDDFEFLARAEHGPFWSTLWLPHGDHVMPLTRLLAWLGLNIFGVTAWPYNVWLLLCMGSAVLGGLLVLEEFRTTRAAQWIFAALVIFWSPWAEMMAGYYILSIYLVIAASGLFATWCLLRWQRTARSQYALGVAICTLIAPLIDISGFYVVGIVGVLLGTTFIASLDQPRRWFSQNRLLWLTMGTAVIISGGTSIYAYRVMNPDVFLGMAAEIDHGLLDYARDLLYLIGGGTLLTMVVPFVYAKLSPGLLAGLTAGTLLGLLVFLIYVWCASDRTRRFTLGAMLLVLGGTALMVVLGRPPAESWPVRWAAKHICPVYFWLCLLLATGWDSLHAMITKHGRITMTHLTVVALFGFITLQTSFGALGLLVSFPPFGYPAELRDARRRRSAIAELRRDVASLHAQLENGAIVPTIDGQALQAVYPSLFRYNLSHYRPFLGARSEHLEWVRNSAMQSWHTPTVRTVPELRAAIAPGFEPLLKADIRLQSLYCAEAPLIGRANWDPFQKNDGHIIESDGQTEVMIQANGWDPALRSQLLIRGLVRSNPDSRLPTVTIIFHSGLLNRDWQAKVQWDGPIGPAMKVDLRQTTAFALSEQVSDLRVVVAAPGRYWFQLAPVDR